MRIGIDGHVLGKQVGGVERFVRELVQQLPIEAPEHEFVILVTQVEFARLQASQDQVHPRVSYVPLLSANPLIERLLLLPWLVYRHRLDALLVQRLSPWLCGRCQLIVTIHDLTPIKFAGAYKGLSNLLVRLLTKNTIQRADLILTPTQAIRAEIQRYCPEVKAPISVFYNGVDVSAFGPAEHQDVQNTPYLLTVGAIERRKDIETILLALNQLKQFPNMHLYIVGKVRDQAYDTLLKQQVLALGLDQRVKWFGFTSEQALIKIYQNASVLISASLDEGFNIPPLEAMACGTPVVCSNILVHQELFEGSALFFEVGDAEALAASVNQLLQQEDVYQRLIVQGMKKVAEYTWTRTAKNVAIALGQLK